MTDFIMDQNDDTANQANTEAERTFDIGGHERPSTAVVDAVASITDTDALDLDPLYSVIDPDHLDGLVEDHDDQNPDSATEISFRYVGCQIALHGDTFHVRYEDDETH